MTVRVSANVHFEAEDREEAEAAIAGWSLHEGCQVSVMLTDTGIPTMQTDAKGNLEPVPEPERAEPLEPVNGQPEEPAEV